MKISNITLKHPGTYFSVEIACPGCTHKNWHKVEYQSKATGDEQRECPWCKGAISFHWEKEGEEQGGTGKS